MKYKVNEIFYSVQAEGANAGRATIFVRFSGCNLQCPFCDTQHESYTEMTASEIDAEVKRLSNNKSTLVVFTGGEPLMQLNDKEELAKGYPRAIESNGMFPVPAWWTINDWLTISPKTKLTMEQLAPASEVKVLYGWFSYEYIKEIEGKVNARLFVQPIERNGKFDVEPVVQFIQQNPAWTLSLQWHKLTGVR